MSRLSSIAELRAFYGIPLLGIARPQSHSLGLERFIDLRIGPQISCSRSIVGIYKSLTDTNVEILGLWPGNSFSGNISFKFFSIDSLQCREKYKP